MPELVTLTEVPSRRDGEGFCFVLQMVGIACVTLPADGGWEVLVAEDSLERARQILAEELQGRRPAAPAIVPSRRGFHWVAALIVANVCAWIVLEGAGGSENRETLVRFGASYAPRILAGEYWRTVTATFLHIGARHLLGNMITLSLFGWLVLKQEGLGRFYFLYVSSGVGGNWFSFLLSPRPAAKAGASGSILGLLGALAGRRVRSARHPTTQPASRFKTWHVLAMLVAFYGFVIGVGPADHLAHVGGILVGALVGLLLPDPQDTAGSRWLAIGLGLGAVSVVGVATLFPVRAWLLSRHVG